MNARRIRGEETTDSKNGPDYGIRERKRERDRERESTKTNTQKMIALLNGNYEGKRIQILRALQAGRTNRRLVRAVRTVSRNSCLSHRNSLHKSTSTTVSQFELDDRN